MKLQEILPWIDPIAMARRVSESEETWAFLCSGQETTFTGRYSLLALKPDEEIVSETFDKLASTLTSDEKKFDNAWFGYLGYGLKNTLEKLSSDSKGFLNYPLLHMVSYRLILLFDHKKKVIEVWAKSGFDTISIPTPIEEYEEEIAVQEIRSNMSKKEYLRKVDEIKEAILRGDLYQANLTRKFFGTLKGVKRPFSLFSKLSSISPSPYSAFLRFGDTYIISSSPEQFLNIDKNGYAESRPIKGSAPRFEQKAWDENSRNALTSSEKDRAENLMIVDLMRNDFSRSCSSVKVKSLFDITSHPTVHHMSSTIIGEKEPSVSTIEFVKNAFPPGSMTGAPKIKAMELSSEMEIVERGIYSGVVGWFGGDGSVDLSVVIRTLILEKNNFEFQVGGAIVADSDPHSEWKETMIKAKAIVETLKIDKGALEKL